MVVVVLGRMAVKLIAATWLAYVGFWREVAAPLHLGGAVAAARGVVAAAQSAAAAAAAAAVTVAVATGGAAGSTAHATVGSALALAAAVAGAVVRLWMSVAAGAAAAAVAARGGASGPALREGAKLLAVAISAAAVMVAVAVAGVSCKRAGERAVAGARAFMGGHVHSFRQHARTPPHTDPRMMHLPSCKLADVHLRRLQWLHECLYHLQVLGERCAAVRSNVR